MARSNGKRSRHRRFWPKRWWHWLVVLLLGIVGFPVALAVLIGTIGIFVKLPVPKPRPQPSTRVAKFRAPSSRTSTTAARARTVPKSRPAVTPGGLQAGCRVGDPLANVYHSYRLRVRSRCTTVTGTVAYIRKEHDGDIHLDLSLPPNESRLLDRANHAYQHGHLVAEIVPADQPGCIRGHAPHLPSAAYSSKSYDYGTCTGAHTDTPSLGSRVRVTGPYVLDSDHGWMEIHPVWAITVISKSPLTTVAQAVRTADMAPARPRPSLDHSPVTAPPVTAPPVTTPPVTTPPVTSPALPYPGPGPSNGAWCEASAAPSNDGYPGDYEVYVHSNRPYKQATASDAGNTWSYGTDGSGYTDIRLYHTSPGMKITVTVDGASCSTTA